MKIRRPDADKARKHLEMQHMAAAAREARVARPRSSAPAGFYPPEPIRVAENFRSAMEAMATATAPAPVALARLRRAVEEVSVSNVAFHLGPAEGEPIDFAAALRVEDRTEVAS